MKRIHIYILGFVVVVSTLLTGCTFCSNKNLVADIVLRKRGTIHIEVEGAGIETLYNEYKVVVYNDEKEKVTTLFFNGKTNIINYKAYKLRSGKCYTFAIERQDRVLVPAKKVRWLHDNRLCLGVGDELSGKLSMDESKPVIQRIVRGNFNATKSTWDNVTIVMQNDHEGLQFAIGGAPQPTNVFTNVRPGRYVATVTDSYGQTASKTFTLPSSDEPVVRKPAVKKEPTVVIPKLPSDQPKDDKPQSMAIPMKNGRIDVQAVLDAVSRAEITTAQAQRILADGSVNLKEPLQPGNIKTLWGVLEEASFGEFFVVKDFQEKKNKIISGTLSLSRKL